jgi:N-acetylglucosaminyldiphosphoundecaprenol N-acetyl-beta-D-mannosaminyltransferase
MDTPFINTDMDTLVQTLDKRLEQSKKTFLVTANPEIMMYARKNPGYFQTLGNADFVIPDGIGVIIGSKILSNPIEQRLAGFDLMMRLFDLASDKGYSIYFLGAEPSVIDNAVQRVKENFPFLSVAGYHHGYFDLDDESIVEDIKAANPDIILAGLGFPKQEQWIERHFPRFEKGLFIGVGGSFDVLAGKTKRAPILWQKLNLEWLYRLLRHPSRWRRMTVLPLFIFEVIKTRRPVKKM